jgi:N-acetylglucosaminyl-diphospho-decaprenol L-rhamnosyltransferase
VSAPPREPAPPDVVVVTWNSRELVLRCVEHLQHSGAARVIVVDNASGDGTSGALAGREDVVVVRLEQPAGLATAFNRGAAQTRADLILFLNDDVFASRESLRALVQGLVGRPTAVAAAGRLVDAEDGRTQTGYLPQAFPRLRGLVAMLAGRSPRRVPVGETETVAVDQPVGACLLVRREAFEAVGGWDEEFEFWYEDVDLARRLAAHGELLYVPTAPFVHVGGHTARRLSRAQLVSRHYRGALLYAAKHFGPAERVGAGLVYAVAAAGRLPLTRDAESRRVYGRVFRNGLRVAAGRRPLPP